MQTIPVRGASLVSEGTGDRSHRIHGPGIAGCLAPWRLGPGGQNGGRDHDQTGRGGRYRRGSGGPGGGRGDPQGQAGLRSHRRWWTGQHLRPERLRAVQAGGPPDGVAGAAPLLALLRRHRGRALDGSGAVPGAAEGSARGRRGPPVAGRHRGSARRADPGGGPLHRPHDAAGRRCLVGVGPVAPADRADGLRSRGPGPRRVRAGACCGSMWTAGTAGSWVVP